ncbi:MAG TPA: MFS transporter [Streptosporangiaceae bacterium]|jgi:MFS family permease|nr:MFS transporter [Streptosporangiaceae bacterium]
MIPAEPPAGRFTAVLNVPAFRHYFVARTVSQFGDRLVPVALAFAVLRATHSAGDLSLVLISSAAAQLAVLPAGGVIADRWPRRSLMIATDLAQFAVTAAVLIAFLLGPVSVALLAAAGAAQGAAAAVFQPAATGLVPALVSPRQLPDANALSQLSEATTRVAGLAAAGVLAAAAGPRGPAWTFAADAATFAASAISLARIRITEPPVRNQASATTAHRPARWRTDLQAGWTAFRSCPWICVVTPVLLLADFGYAVFIVLGPLACLRYYHGAVTWSAVSAIGAAGSVAGGLATARFRPRHPLRWALPAAACFALPPLALAARLPVAAVAASSVLGETGLLLFARLYLTALQRTFAPDVMSRVSSFGLTGSAAAYPLGLACAAPLAGAVTAGPALGLAGVVMMVSILGPLLAPSTRSFEQSIE